MRKKSYDCVSISPFGNAGKAAHSVTPDGRPSLTRLERNK